MRNAVTCASAAQPLSPWDRSCCRAPSGRARHPVRAGGVCSHSSVTSHAGNSPSTPYQPTAGEVSPFCARALQAIRIHRQDRQVRQPRPLRHDGRRRDRDFSGSKRVRFTRAGGRGARWKTCSSVCASSSRPDQIAQNPVPRLDIEDRPPVREAVVCPWLDLQPRVRIQA